MASAGWQKQTTTGAKKARVHFDDFERSKREHSNRHINKDLSHLNFCIGSDTWDEAVTKMIQRTEEVDKLYPPKRKVDDRITCCFVEFPCPQSIEDMGREKEFFEKIYEVEKEFFGPENVHGGFVHKDEKHEYINKTGETKNSLYHMHTLVSAYVEWEEPVTKNVKQANGKYKKVPTGEIRERKGINGKAFETKARLKSFNKLIDDMCLREFGIRYNTGAFAEKKSVEQLKLETEKRAAEIEKAVAAVEYPAFEPVPFTKKKVIISAEDYQKIREQAEQNAIDKTLVNMALSDAARQKLSLDGRETALTAKEADFTEKEKKIKTDLELAEKALNDANARDLNSMIREGLVEEREQNTDVLELQRQLDEARRAREGAKRETERYKNKMEWHKQDAQELNDKVTDLEAVIKSKDNIIADKDNKIEELSNTITSTESELNKYRMWYKAAMDVGMRFIKNFTDLVTQAVQGKSNERSTRSSDSR